MRRSISRTPFFCNEISLTNMIKVYWYTEVVNFGDLITPLLLQYYGLSPHWHSIGRSQLLSAGSILQGVPENYAGHIIGSGLIEDKSLHLNKAKIWALRGKLTQTRIHAPADTILGDPGLLSVKLLKKRPLKSYTLGIVPHFVDKKNRCVAKIKEKYPKEIRVINVMRNPLMVFQDICKCRFILSSSLHGIITANAFGIPNAWIQLSNRVIGNGFKFYDYFSGIGVKRKPFHLNGNEKISQLLELCNMPPVSIEEKQEQLDRTFQSFRDFWMGNQRV